MRYRAAPVVLAALLATACQKGVTIEGDLSLDAAKGGFRTVALVRNPGDSVLTVIDAQCAADRADIARRAESIKTHQATVQRFSRTRARTTMEEVALSDSAQKYRLAAAAEQRALSDRPDTTYQNNAAVVRAATDTQVQADANGHFRFTKRQKGKYLLYVEWLAATGDNEFLAPVDASAGGKKTQNLDRSTVSTRLRCR